MDIHIHENMVQFLKIKHAVKLPKTADIILRVLFHFLFSKPLLHLYNIQWTWLVDRFDETKSIKSEVSHRPQCNLDVTF